MDSYIKTPNPYNPNQSPDISRLILEKEYSKWANGNNQQTQQNIYNEYLLLLESCTLVQKQKIATHPDFIEADGRCEAALKEWLYAQAIPHVLSTPKGQQYFEELFYVTKKIKDEVVKREVEKEKELEQREKDLEEKSRQMDMLLSNPEIQRILSGQNNQNANNKQNKNPQNVKSEGNN